MAKITATMYAWEDHNKVKIHLNFLTEFDQTICNVSVRLRSLRSFLQALTGPQNHLSVYLYDLTPRECWPADEVGIHVYPIPSLQPRPKAIEWDERQYHEPHEIVPVNS